MNAMANAVDKLINRVNLCLNSVADDHPRLRSKAALLTGVGDVDIDLKIAGRVELIFMHATGRNNF